MKVKNLSDYDLTDYRIESVTPYQLEFSQAFRIKCNKHKREPLAPGQDCFIHPNLQIQRCLQQKTILYFNLYSMYFRTLWTERFITYELTLKHTLAIFPDFPLHKLNDNDLEYIELDINSREFDDLMVYHLYEMDSTKTERLLTLMEKLKMHGFTRTLRSKIDDSILEYSITIKDVRDFLEISLPRIAPMPSVKDLDLGGYS
jgi:hypothetical protein